MKYRIRIVLPYLFLFCGAIVFVLPTAYIIISSFQTGETLTLQPAAFSLDRYLTLFFEESRFPFAMLRSIWIALTTAIGATIVAFLSGYVFAKVNFRGRDLIFFCYLLLMLCPYQVTIVPNYLMIRLLGLYNTNLALILPGIFAPMMVVLMRQFIGQVGDSLCLSFRLDSQNTFQILLSVVLPCSKVGVALVFVLAFAEAWNMVEQPLFLLENASRYPLSVLLNRILSEGTVLAGSVVFMLPVYFLVTLFNAQLMEGMTATK